MSAQDSEGGKAFFYENSAMSSLLIWFRQHVVGRWWVPKCGDEEEFPLTPGEVDVLRHAFAVRVAYPEFMFFRLASWYLLKGRLIGAFSLLDRIGYRPGSERTATTSTSTSAERVERTLDEPSVLGAEPFRREAPGVLGRAAGRFWRIP